MTRKQLALHLLEQADEHGVTTAEFLRGGVGSRYGARLLELRAEGYVIESVRLRDGAWRYTLLSGPGGDAECVSGGNGADRSPRPVAGPDQVGNPALFELGDAPRSAALHDYEEGGAWGVR